METIVTSPYDSPVGRLVIGALGERICLCDWSDDGIRPRAIVEQRLRRRLEARMEEGDAAVIDRARRQLDKYFSGARERFQLPLAMGGTDLQLTVWQRLCSIPFASTVSYRELAAAVGRPSAVRAVAAACGANAISIIVPCHRVTGSDGSLTGYAGGVEAKRRLIAMERRAHRSTLNDNLLT